MRSERKLYRELAINIDWLNRTLEDPSKGFWSNKAQDHINTIMADSPSGSGIDAGTALDLNESTGNKIIFRVSYHHMNDAGYYDGWTEHKITVKPSLTSDYDLTIGGRDRNNIKDHLYETFDYWLKALVVDDGDIYEVLPS